MHIREMVESDTASLEQLYLTSRRHSFFWLDTDSLALEDFVQDTVGERVWVAEHGQRLVGFVSVWESENYIHNLFVLPGYFRRGVGGELLDTCLQKIGRPARLKCLSENTLALGFYEARGWRSIAEGMGSEGEYQVL